MRLRKSGRLYLPQQGESRFLPLSAPVVSLRNSLAQGPRHVPAAALSPAERSVLLYVQQRPYGLLGARSRGRPPRLSHSSATTGSSSVFLYVHRDSTDCWGQGAHDVHLDFHTAHELCHDCFKFNIALRPERQYGLLGTRSPRRPPRLLHSC